jgi:N-acetylglucosaminyldiphosphoundecaprenol N-acetyl-beta-D-mannosaminyltransferase
VAHQIFGVRLDEIGSPDELERMCVAFLEGDRARRIFTPNPEILLRARDDRAYAELLSTADLALPDGTGVALVEALLARRRVRRWPGVELGVIGSGLRIEDDGRAHPDDRDAEILEELRRAEPALVLVGLGAPKQERWIAAHADDLPSARILIGVGGAFDMWAGRLRRAPRVLHRVGLEWAWRLALEPGRFPRIVRATLVFPFRALTERAG